MYTGSEIGLGAHDLADSSLSYTGVESNNYVGGTVHGTGDLNNDGVRDLSRCIGKHRCEHT